MLSAKARIASNGSTPAAARGLNESIPPHLPPRIRSATARSGCEARLGCRTHSTFSCPSRKAASLVAFSLARSTRSGRVRAPRAISQELNGDAAPPRRSVWRRIGSTSALDPAAIPPSASPCPETHLVVVCSTRSAPCSSGRITTGLKKVLSITRSAPASCAIFASAGRSLIRIHGFESTSAKMMRVFGRIAAFTAARSVIATGVTSMPRVGKSSAKRI